MWTSEHDAILVGRCDKARCMGWLCAHASNYYNRQRQNLLVPATGVSWALNVFGMVATYVGKRRLPEDVVILVVSLGNFIVATLTSIAERSKAGDKVELFNQTARDFNQVASEIKHQLMLPYPMRIPVEKVLGDSEKRYQDLMKSTPSIPGQVVSRFMETHRNDPGFESIDKPEGLIEIVPTRYSLYRPPCENENKVSDNTESDALNEVL